MPNVQRPQTFLDRLISWLRPRIRNVHTADSRSWARLVKSEGELPGLYRPFFDSLPAQARQPFPHTVLTPTFKGVARRLERERLLCLTDDSLFILEASDEQAAPIRYPLNGRCLVERGVVLLHSWITIHGPSSDSGSGHTTLRFNSVTDHLMTPFVDRLRAAPADSNSASVEAERERFNYLAQTHYKFYSHGRSSIRPGAKVIHILLQPEIRRGQIAFFGYSLFRRLSTAHLAILTDQELILVRDDDSQFWLQGQPHGAIWSYIPRGLIEAASLDPLDHDLLALRIDVAGRISLKSTYEAGAEMELRSLLQQMQ